MKSWYLALFLGSTTSISHRSIMSQFNPGSSPHISFILGLHPVLTLHLVGRWCVSDAALHTCFWNLTYRGKAWETGPRILFGKTGPKTSSKYLITEQRKIYWRTDKIILQFLKNGENSVSPPYILHVISGILKLWTCLYVQNCKWQITTLRVAYFKNVKMKQVAIYLLPFEQNDNGDPGWMVSRHVI